MRPFARCTGTGETRLYGVETNRSYLRQILTFTPFACGEPWTRCLEGLTYQASTVEVLSAGTQTSVQDYPGRVGYWGGRAALRANGQPRLASGQPPAGQ
jgi:hypothetical protein